MVVCLQAALTHSLPLKKAEFILPSLTIWGRITALNGRDYIIAESSQNPHMEDSKAHLGTMFFMTQDGVAWADLPASTDEQREIAKNMRGLLRGDTTTKHYWPPKQTEEEESSAEEGEQTKQYKEITELQRLRTMIDSINEATNLAPVGSQIVTADDDIVTNPLFPGLDYPDKLEAYFHRHKGPNGAFSPLHLTSGKHTIV
jgi:radial spoke head protein 9